MQKALIGSRITALIFASFFLCTSAAGCKCSGKLTDEERLKKQINVTSVYMYVATKVAVTKAGDDPEIKQARENLMAFFKAVSKIKTGEGGDQGDLSKLKE